MKVCNTLQLQVEDLRAIQEADIDLKSMTVLTGPSGSGKSELLKFTYRLLDSISRYEQIIRTEPYQQMDSIEKDLYQIVQSLPSAHLKKTFRKPRSCRAKPDKQYWSEQLEILHQTYTSEYELNGLKKPGKIYTYNSEHLRSIRDKIGLEADYRRVDFPELLHHIRNYQEKIFRLSEERLSKRPYKHLKQISRDIHYSIHYPTHFQLLQNNQLIAKDNFPFVGRIENIQKVYYLSSTWGWHIRSYLEDSWFRKAGRTIPDSRLFDHQTEIKEMLETIIGGEILLPEIYQDKKNTRYEWSHHVCKRKDGTQIPLRCCGASMNNFLTIYRMLKKRITG
ncbi:MAG: hypothetical protein LUG51_15975 [Tannerellaceae bacterium]|nr:hypothetical protein [Tannerellaceae bacterium]